MANSLPLQEPYLAIAQIQDQYLRKNFENLASYFSRENQLLGFQFYEVVFEEAVTGYALAHGLAYIPLDIIVTRITGDGSVTFRYGEFDLQYIVMDVSGPCRIRFYAGTYSKFVSPIETSDEDEQVISPSISSGEPLTYLKQTVPLTSEELATGDFPQSTSRNLRVRPTRDTVILVDTTLFNQTVTLPDASEMEGKFLFIKKTDGGAKTLTISASDRIDGSLTVALTAAYARVILFCNGTTYYRME